MKRIMKFFFMVLVFGSCATLDREVGNGILETKTVELSSFDGISYDISHDLTIKQGDTHEVKIVGDSNILDHVELEIRDGVLYIDLISGSYINIDLKIEVTVASLKSIENTSSGDIYVEPRDEDREVLNVTVDGSGNITISDQENVQEIDILIDGSGDILFDEETNIANLKITTDGSGNLFGYPLISKKCELFTDGGGDLQITVNEDLKGTIEGNGDIYYKGNPTIQVAIKGSGELIDKN